MSEPIGDLLAGAPAIAELRPLLAGGDKPSWLVGGVVRDLLMGRPLHDVDVAVGGDARPPARRLHDALGGDIFSLSDRFGTWRVQPGDRDYHVDISPLRGATIEADLAQRDFTIGAIAVALAGDPELIDPHGGAEDLEARRIRVLGESAYRDDPLRPLRMARLSAQLGFDPDPETVALTRAFAAAVTGAAAERIFAELRALVACDRAVAGLGLFFDVELAASVLPELVELQGVDQSVYHHRDVLGHTFEVVERTIELETTLDEVFADVAPDLRTQLDRPLADELTRGAALRWGALLHDIAKPQTRTEWPGGRVGFPGHDEIGHDMIRAICRRLHTSEKFAGYVSALSLHHLRLGFLVGQSLDRRTAYVYLTACRPVEVEVGVLSVADRLATRGRKAEQAIPPHLQLAREMTRYALDWRAHRAAEPLVRGDRLAAELGIEPGAGLGALLALIDEAHFVGEVNTAQEALALAREHVDRV